MRSRTLRALAGALAIVLAGLTVATPSEANPLPPPLGPPPREEHAPPSQQRSSSQHPPLPADSGSGRRIVYSVSRQRVWLVEGDESVVASWLVSGRKGIPKEGTYSVFSRSRWSRAGNVRFEFMVRFVQGRRAIGFHAIPVDRRGRPVQSESELGQPRSRGCVRQSRPTAEHLWNWAPVGTKVRVKA